MENPDEDANEDKGDDEWEDMEEEKEEEEEEEDLQRRTVHKRGVCLLHLPLRNGKGAKLPVDGLANKYLRPQWGLANKNAENKMEEDTRGCRKRSKRSVRFRQLGGPSFEERKPTTLEKEQTNLILSELSSEFIFYWPSLF